MMEPQRKECSIFQCGSRLVSRTGCTWGPCQLYLPPGASSPCRQRCACEQPSCAKHTPVMAPACWGRHNMSAKQNFRATGIKKTKLCRGHLRKCKQRWHRRWLQEGFARWRASSALLRRRRSLLQRAHARQASRLTRAAMSAWLQHMECQHTLRHAEVWLLPPG